MNLKRIIIAMTVALIGTGNINAQDMKTEVPKISDFPVGEENTGYAQYFTGKSWLAPLTTSKELNVPMSNVTFEPGCRNNWHSHTGGQLLVAVGGIGYYQERGKTARRLLPGDVVEIAPNVEHWHGAAPDSWFSHLAIACNPQTNQNTWLEVVNDEEYAEAVKDQRSENKKDMNRIDLCKENFTQLFGGEALTGESTDPEMMDILQKYIFGEVFRTGNLDMKTREMITCVSLAANAATATAQESCRSYIKCRGDSDRIARSYLSMCSFHTSGQSTEIALGTINSTFTERGIKLPLEKQETVTEENRFEKGLAIQEPLYGEAMKEFLKDVPGGMGADVARFLTEVHFGDFQTRSGLNTQTRELLTFCVLTVIGAESQLPLHLQANLKVGNSKETLTAAVIQCMPYIGFPAAIKVLDIIKEA